MPSRVLHGASALQCVLGRLARLVLSGTVFVRLKRTAEMLREVAGRRGCCTEGSASSGRVCGTAFLWCVLVLLARLVSSSAVVVEWDGGVRMPREGRGVSGMRALGEEE